MIDIHSHILPGVDDGSQDLSLSRTLIEDALADGITAICLTPHFVPFYGFGKRRDELEKIFGKFKEETADLGMKIFLGNELFIRHDLDVLLEEKQVCSLNDTRYVLVEFPFEGYQDDYDEYLYNISLNCRIIIAHPERYAFVKEDPSFVRRWTDNGYLLQANSTSLKQRDTRSCIYYFLDNGLLSVMASDAHGLHRSLKLKEAYEMISHAYDEQTAELLMQVNPQAILNDEDTLKVPKTRRHILW